MTTFAGRMDLPITSEEELEAQKLVERGEIDQAIALCQRLKSANGRMFHLAGVLYAEKKGDPHSAIDSFQEALRIQEENGVDTSDILTELGFAHQNLNEFDLALLYHLRALHLRQNCENINPKLVATSLLGLANAYWGQHDLPQALIYAQEALALNKSVDNGNDLHIAANLAILANIYHNAHDHHRALDVAKQALTIFERCLSSDSISLATVLNNIGTIQVSGGMLDDALITFVRLLHIYERILPEGHPTRMTIENNIQRITETNKVNIINSFRRFSKFLTRSILV